MLTQHAVDRDVDATCAACVVFSQQATRLRSTRSMLIGKLVDAKCVDSSCRLPSGGARGAHSRRLPARMLTQHAADRDVGATCYMCCVLPAGYPLEVHEVLVCCFNLLSTGVFI
jgi:hypothetical protein